MEELDIGAADVAKRLPRFWSRLAGMRLSKPPATMRDDWQMTYPVTHHLPCRHNTRLDFVTSPPCSLLGAVRVHR